MVLVPLVILFNLGNYIKSIVIREGERKANYFDLEIHRRNGFIYSIDHTFSAVKHQSKINGVRAFEAWCTLMNEYNEIRGHYMVPSAGHEHIKHPLDKAYETMVSFGILPQIVYTDKCCSDREFLGMVFPSLVSNSTPLLCKESEINTSVFIDMPLEVPSGSLYYAANASGIISQTSSISLLASESKQNGLGPFIVALDAEWTANGSKLEVVQLSYRPCDGAEPVVVVVPIDKEIHPSLKCLLMDPNVLFVGNYLHSVDFEKLSNWHFIHVPSDRGISLNLLAKQKGLIQTKTGGYTSVVSLRIMSQMLIKRDVPKDQRTSNWQLRPLSQNQIQYAARDALASLLCYEVLIKLPDKDPNPSKACDEPGILPFVLKAPVIQPTVIRCKLDPLHAMKRILDIVPKKHPFAWLFTTKLRDAIFIVDKDDRERVDKFLLKNQSSFEQRMLQDPDWVLKRVRRVIPPPGPLRQRLENVIALFKDSSFAHDGLPLVSPAVEEQVKNLLKHVDKGCLSDPQGVPVYFATQRDKNGLMIYRCVRGTNNAELWHHFLSTHFEPWNAGPRLANVLMSILVHRYNVRASERSRPDFSKLGIYDHYLIDSLKVGPL